MPKTNECANKNVTKNANKNVNKSANKNVNKSANKNVIKKTNKSASKNVDKINFTKLNVGPDLDDQKNRIHNLFFSINEV